MEHASGRQLAEVWPTMDGPQQIRCIKSIYETIQEVANIKFTAFGSLYFKNSLPAYGAT